MLNNKGYTLVELLATMVILGIIMAVTIPNISGITTQNKITTYAEDAKKFKNTAEYMFRGDDTVIKPNANGECVIINLKYVHGNDYDAPPYGGKYDMNNSFVVMVKKSKRYHYYVQLVEKYSADGIDNYKGFSLINYTELEGNTYLDKVTEGVNMTPFVSVSNWNVPNDADKAAMLNSARDVPSSKSIKDITECTKLLEVYYAA